MVLNNNIYIGAFSLEIMAKTYVIFTERNRYPVTDKSGILKGARLFIDVRNKKRLILGFGKSAIPFLGEIGNAENKYKYLKNSMNATRAVVENGSIIGYKLIFVDYKLIEACLENSYISNEDWKVIVGKGASNIGNTSDVSEVKIE